MEFPVCPFYKWLFACSLGIFFFFAWEHLVGSGQQGGGQSPLYYGGIFSKIITGIFENLIILKMHATDKTIFKIPLKINLKL